MPSFCCSSPVVAEGELLYAGWSPGGADDNEFKLPSFDQLLASDAGDADKDGALSREEAQKGPWRDFFDANDTNKDGRITRDEWETVVSFLASAKNRAFTLTAGCEGDASGHIRWQQTKGLPYVPTAIAYAGQYVMVKDGGIVTAYDAKTGDLVYHKRAVASGGYYASPVAAGGNIYFASLRDGAITVIEAGGPAPKVVAKNEPLGERIAATPAIADDTLYVRTAGHLYAFAEQP
jgi:outer membrane protein assembly factor BamB